MIRYLAKNGGSSEARAASIQQFYEELRRMLEYHPNFKDLSKEELDLTMDLIETRIFTRKHLGHLDSLRDQDDFLDDRYFCERTSSLAKIPSSNLFGLPECETVPELPDAVESLQNFVNATSPCEKLNHLIFFVKICASSRNEQGADMLIPTMAMLIVNHTPATLISDLRFIHRFRNHGRFVGEAAYCLTNVKAVIESIDKLYNEQVKQINSLYSKLASQEDLRADGGAGGGSKPLTDIASSFMYTIGFVPRAIGGALADTFRSRAAKQTSASTSTMGSASMSMTARVEDATKLDIIPPIDEELVELRKKIGTLQDWRSLNLREVELVIEDYRRILDFVL